MPKAILEFNLPEESLEFRHACKGTDLSLVIWDLDQWLRQLHKYESREGIEQNSKDLVDYAWDIRQKLNELINEYSCREVVE